MPAAPPPALSVHAPPHPRPLEDSELLRLRGEAALRSGRWAEAKRCFKRALALAPEQPTLRGALGAAYLAAGRYARAAVEFQRAFQQIPAEAEAHASLGAILRNMGRVDEAVAHQRRAVSLKPASVEAHRELGDALSETGALQEAIRSYQQALALKPDDLAAQLNLAGSLRRAGRMPEAVAAFRRVGALRPEFPDTFVALGDTLLALGQPDAARLQYDRALALAPDHAEAHWARAKLALLLGDAGPAAWDDFAWRARVLDAAPPPSEAPAWAGEPLEGRTILLHAERWLADTVQFVRHVPRIAGLGGRVVLAVQPALLGVLQGFPGAAEVVALGGPLPAHDLCAPLGGLPGILRDDPGSLAFAPPYLPRTGAARRDGGPLRVGLVWAGDPANPCDAERSCDIEALGGLARLPGVRFVSLQAGPRAGESGRLGADVASPPLDPGDMATLVRALAEIDLAIGVDTAPVHLAAAMGVATWVMLPFVPDWRWRLNGSDSPWYPTARLFRPSAPGDWREVLSAVEAALAELAHPDA